MIRVGMYVESLYQEMKKRFIFPKWIHKMKEALELDKYV